MSCSLSRISIFFFILQNGQNMPSRRIVPEGHALYFALQFAPHMIFKARWDVEGPNWFEQFLIRGA